MKMERSCKTTEQMMLRVIVEPLDHIIFNCYKPRYNSYHVNECAEVEHGKKSLDYQPLMYAIINVKKLTFDDSEI